jgi:hypothetical protein
VRHNLDSAKGIRSALAEIESVRRSLQQRLCTVEGGGELEEVESEGSSRDESNEDEDKDDDKDEDDKDKDEEDDNKDSFKGFLS